MDYKAYSQSLDENVRLDIREAKLSPSIMKKIESIIKKPVPYELIEFYSFCDGLTWKNDKTYGPPPEGIQGIPSMSEELTSLQKMFDNFKTQPDLEFDEWDEDGENWSERSEYFHSSIFLEDVNPYDNEWLDISNKEGKEYFWKLSNMKLVCDFKGHEGTIVIDFTITEKPYQLYYQVYGELTPLNLTLEKFYTLFLQIGLTDFWFCAYMRTEDQESLNFIYTKDTHKVIKHFYPKFDLNQLPAITVS